MSTVTKLKGGTKTEILLTVTPMTPTLSLAHLEVHPAEKAMVLGPSYCSGLRETNLTRFLPSPLTSVTDPESYHFQTNTELYLFPDMLK